MKYRCSKCGSSVVVKPDGDTIRICDCNATIHAEIVAVAKGKGGFIKK